MVVARWLKVVAFVWLTLFAILTYVFNASARNFPLLASMYHPSANSNADTRSAGTLDHISADSTASILRETSRDSLDTNMARSAETSDHASAESIAKVLQETSRDSLNANMAGLVSICKEQERLQELAAAAKLNASLRQGRWHPQGTKNANRCGRTFAVSDGAPAECDPLSLFPCCGSSGWCGLSPDHCLAAGGVNYGKGAGYDAYRSLQALRYWCNMTASEQARLWAQGMQSFGTEEALSHALLQSRRADTELAGQPLMVFMNHHDWTTIAFSIPERKRDESQLKSHRLGESEVALDVGGHVGVTAIHIACLNPGHKVVTLEPSPHNFFYLEWNLAANKAESVIAINAGMSSHGRPLEFHINAGDTTGSSAYAKQANKHQLSLSKSVSVPTMTLAKLREKHGFNSIGFMKLDCEGCEFDAVPTWSASEWQSIRRIGGEVHPQTFHAFNKTQVDFTLDRICRGGKSSHVEFCHVSPRLDPHRPGKYQ